MKKEIIAVASEEALAELSGDFPKESSFTRIVLPKFGMLSQDLTQTVGTGKAKKIELVQPAGAFYIEQKTGEKITRDDGTEVDEYAKTFLEDEAPMVHIVYSRKMLSHYDEATETYTSSPIYDEDTEIVPLFEKKQEVARGTPAQLKALPRFRTLSKKTGKPTSSLRDERVLYVVYNGELMQLQLHGSSLWAFVAYAKKVSPPRVLTRLGSENKVNGSIEWSPMTFVPERQITADEAAVAIEFKNALITAIKAEKSYYEGVVSQIEVADKQMDAISAPVDFAPVERSPRF